MFQDFFAGFENPDLIKRRYRDLAMQYHPDRGGDLRTMQEINRQYDLALQKISGRKFYAKKEDGGSREYTYRYDAQAEAEVKAIIDSLLKLKMREVDILLIGSWVWITGATKPHKDKIKSLGCYWHSKRECWYWHKRQPYKTRFSNRSLSDIARKYGYAEFSPKFDPEIEKH